MKESITWTAADYENHANYIQSIPTQYHLKHNTIALLRYAAKYIRDMESHKAVKVIECDNCGSTVGCLCHRMGIGSGS